MLGDSAAAVVIGILGVFASGVGLCRRLNGWRASIRLLLNVRSIPDIVRLSDKGKPFSDKVAICRGEGYGDPVSRKTGLMSSWICSESLAWRFSWSEKFLVLGMGTLSSLGLQTL